MSEARDLYLRAAGLIANNKRDARKSALDRSHAIRQFEIDLYWKRANYFWLLQAAVFAAVGLTWKLDSGSIPKIVPVGLAALGTITAWAGWLAAHSSKFWQRNWEHQIDMLESEFEGNLYKIVYVGPSGIRWSLTGISEGLAFCFFSFWILVLLMISFSVNPNWSLRFDELSWPLNTMEIMTFGSWVLTIVGLFFLFKQGSGVKGNVVGYDDSLSFVGDSTEMPKLRRNRAAKPYLIRREPKI